MWTTEIPDLRYELTMYLLVETNTVHHHVDVEYCHTVKTDFGHIAFSTARVGSRRHYGSVSTCHFLRAFLVKTYVRVFLDLTLTHSIVRNR